MNKSILVDDVDADADALKPEAVEPEAVEPKAVEPEAVEPKAVEPAVEPKAVEPKAVEPAVEPKAVAPDDDTCIFECGICYNDVSSSKAVKCNKCLKQICKDCVIQLQQIVPNTFCHNCNTKHPKIKCPFCRQPKLNIDCDKEIQACLKPIPLTRSTRTNPYHIYVVFIMYEDGDDDNVNV